MPKNNKVSKEAFVKELVEVLSGLLGEEFQIQQGVTEKLNKVQKQTLLIRKEGTFCAPNFYIDDLYEGYCGGRETEDIAMGLAEVARREDVIPASLTKEICTKEWIQKNVFLRIVNLEENEELLRDSVYYPMLDLAAVYYVMTSQDEDGMRSYRMTERIWEQAELGGAEELYETALANTARLFPEKVENIEDCLRSILQARNIDAEEELEEVLKGRKPVFLVISNESRINGASVILYPGLLEGLWRKYGNYYLIPSSIHEMLLLSEQDVGDYAMLNEMVQEVNANQLEPEERLSDHVYFYSPAGGLVSKRNNA